MNVYDSCPTFITPRFTLRLVRMEDAPGLLKVYSDKVAQNYFNADNCVSDFRYATLWEMENCIRMWLESYARRQFVRWTIFYEKKPVGTVEMFRQGEGENGEGLGVLRIDLLSMYEFPDVYDELLRTLLPELHELFSCQRILTKSLPIMERRRLALVLHGFIPYKKFLVGDNGIEYGNYWVRRYNPSTDSISSPRRRRWHDPD